jgi:hypothetical protein
MLVIRPLSLIMLMVREMIGVLIEDWAGIRESITSLISLLLRYKFFYK